MDDNFTHGDDANNVNGGPKQSGSMLPTLLKVLAGLAIVGILIAMLLPAVRTARPAANRNACANNLKQIALALQQYADKHGALPPAYTTDSEGKPLHSWRTLILPYLEERTLYESIDLTKPWNDPVNAKACKTRVPAYECPGNLDEDSLTTYLAVLTPNSCMQASQPRKPSDIKNPKQTLMLVEVDLDHAVPRMSPVDADEKTVMGIGPESKCAHPGGFQTAFADCHVEFQLDDQTPVQRRALISIEAADKAALEEAK